MTVHNIHEEVWNEQLSKLVQAITHLDTTYDVERGHWRVQGTLSPDYEGYIPPCEVWNSPKGRVYTFHLKPLTEAEKVIATHGVDPLWYAIDGDSLWCIGIDEVRIPLTEEEKALVQKDVIQICSGVIDKGVRYHVSVMVNSNDGQTTHTVKRCATSPVDVADIIRKAETYYGSRANSVEAKVYLNW